MHRYSSTAALVTPILWRRIPPFVSLQSPCTHLIVQNNTAPMSRIVVPPSSTAPEPSAPAAPFAVAEASISATLIYFATTHRSKPRLVMNVPAAEPPPPHPTLLWTSSPELSISGSVLAQIASKAIPSCRPQPVHLRPNVSNPASTQPPNATHLSCRTCAPLLPSPSPSRLSRPMTRTAMLIARSHSEAFADAPSCLHQVFPRLIGRQAGHSTVSHGGMQLPHILPRGQSFSENMNTDSQITAARYTGIEVSGLRQAPTMRPFVSLPRASLSSRMQKAFSLQSLAHDRPSLNRASRRLQMTSAPCGARSDCRDVLSAGQGSKAFRLQVQMRLSQLDKRVARVQDVMHITLQSGSPMRLATKARRSLGGGRISDFVRLLSNPNAIFQPCRHVSSRLLRDSTWRHDTLAALPALAVARPARCTAKEAKTSLRSNIWVG